MPDELEECKDRNRELEHENELLRESAETFGALADRLNKQLHGDRTDDTPEQPSKADPAER